jgi:hypothetical protein
MGKPSEAELEALLRVKAAIDPRDNLPWRKVGRVTDYCSEWWEVFCNNGLVIEIGPPKWHLWRMDPQALCGTLPPASAFDGLNHLGIINWSSAGITGTLPANWSHLTNLHAIDLSGNRLTGSIPSSWGNLTQLTQLWLHSNMLSGTLPDALKGLSKLEQLAVRNNTLRGRVPGSWAALKSLQAVALDSNPQLEGCLPASWRSQLTQWYFQDTGVTGFC